MAPFKCCGCGAEAVGLTKPCDCPTMVGWRNTGDRKTEYCTWDSPPDPRDATIATLRALLDRAEKALEPFGKCARSFEGKYPPGHDNRRYAPGVIVRDFRLARSTLEDIRKGKG
jgi:hypothetical protein